MLLYAGIIVVEILEYLHLILLIVCYLEFLLNVEIWLPSNQNWNSI